MSLDNVICHYTLNCLLCFITCCYIIITNYTLLHVITNYTLLHIITYYTLLHIITNFILLTGAHSSFILLSAFSRANSLLAASLMLSNLVTYCSRPMSISLDKNISSDGFTGNPTISDI